MNAIVLEVVPEFIANLLKSVTTINRGLPVRNNGTDVDNRIRSKTGNSGTPDVFNADTVVTKSSTYSGGLSLKLLGPLGVDSIEQ